MKYIKPEISSMEIIVEGAPCTSSVASGQIFFEGGSTDDEFINPADIF